MASSPARAKRSADRGLRWLAFFRQCGIGYGSTTSSEITTGRLEVTPAGVGIPAPLDIAPGEPPGPEGSMGAAAPPGRPGPPGTMWPPAGMPPSIPPLRH